MPATAPLTSYSELFAGLRAGQVGYRDRLIGRFYQRIVRLVAAMLKTFPPVKQRREVESVTHDLIIRLMKALDDPALQLGSEDDFFRLAAHKLRHLLIDEVEKHRNRNRLLPRVPLDGPFEPADADTCNPAEMEEWHRFWTQLAQLPAEEQRIFEMHFLMDMTQAEIAKILGRPAKQVSRTWIATSLKLANHLPSV